MLDDKFDAFTVALTTFSAHVEEEEVLQYETHLLVWAEFCGWMKDRGESTIRILDTAATGIQHDRTRPAVNFHALGTTYTVVEPQGASGGINQGAGTSKEFTGAITLPTQAQTGAVATEQVNAVQVNTEQVDTEQADAVQVNRGGTPSIVTVPDGGTGSGNSRTDTNLQLALMAMNSMSDSIHKDLETAEHEVNVVDLSHNEAFGDLKAFCSEIEGRVRVDYKEACEKAVRLDTDRITGAIGALADNTKDFLNRL